MPGTYTPSVRRTPNQTDSDVTCSDRAIKGKSQKALKDNQDWEKPIKKKTNHLFFCYSIFEKKQDFVL